MFILTIFTLAHVLKIVINLISVKETSQKTIINIPTTNGSKSG
jgi:hypothetical protein